MSERWPEFTHISHRGPVALPQPNSAGLWQQGENAPNPLLCTNQWCCLFFVLFFLVFVCFAGDPKLPRACLWLPRLPDLALAQPSSFPGAALKAGKSVRAKEERVGPGAVLSLSSGIRSQRFSGAVRAPGLGSGPDFQHWQPLVLPHIPAKCPQLRVAASSVGH